MVAWDTNGTLTAKSNIISGDKFFFPGGSYLYVNGANLVWNNGADHILA
jgi:hypothetical protein